MKMQEKYIGFGKQKTVNERINEIESQFHGLSKKIPMSVILTLPND
ncbi:MAG: hypothetical protein IKN34_11835 [Treponema sp.]|nr:hypothetical protein [Treponema sp.]